MLHSSLPIQESKDICGPPHAGEPACIFSHHSPQPALLQAESEENIACVALASSLQAHERPARVTGQQCNTDPEWPPAHVGELATVDSGTDHIQSKTGAHPCTVPEP